MRRPKASQIAMIKAIQLANWMKVSKVIILSELDLGPGLP
jgi:hypothetical protein